MNDYRRGLNPIPKPHVKHARGSHVFVPRKEGSQSDPSSFAVAALHSGFLERAEAALQRRKWKPVQGWFINAPIERLGRAELQEMK